MHEYLGLRQQWPALHDRWVANKGHPDGTEWAVFDMLGKIEFVRRGGDIITDSLAFPNQYALGRVIEVEVEVEPQQSPGAPPVLSQPATVHAGKLASNE